MGFWDVITGGGSEEKKPAPQAKAKPASLPNEGDIQFTVNGYVGGPNWEHGAYTAIGERDGRERYSNLADIPRDPNSRTAMDSRPVLRINVGETSMSFGVYAHAQAYLGPGNADVTGATPEMQARYNQAQPWNDIPEEIKGLTTKHAVTPEQKNRLMAEGRKMVTIDRAVDNRFANIPMGMTGMIDTTHGAEVMQQAVRLAQEQGLEVRASGKGAVEIVLPPEAVHSLRAMTKDYITHGAFSSGDKMDAQKSVIHTQKVNQQQLGALLESFIDPSDTPAKLQAKPLNDIGEIARRVSGQAEAPTRKPQAQEQEEAPAKKPARAVAPEAKDPQTPAAKQPVRATATPPSDPQPQEASKPSTAPVKASPPPPPVPTASVTTQPVKSPPPPPPPVPQPSIAQSNAPTKASPPPPPPPPVKASPAQAKMEEAHRMMASAMGLEGEKNPTTAFASMLHDAQTQAGNPPPVSASRYADYLKSQGVNFNNPDDPKLKQYVAEVQKYTSPPVADAPLRQPPPVPEKPQRLHEKISHDALRYALGETKPIDAVQASQKFDQHLKEAMGTISDPALKAMVERSDTAKAMLVKNYVENGGTPEYGKEMAKLSTAMKTGEGQRAAYSEFTAKVNEFAQKNPLPEAPEKVAQYRGDKVEPMHKRNADGTRGAHYQSDDFGEMGMGGRDDVARVQRRPSRRTSAAPEEVPETKATAAPSTSVAASTDTPAPKAGAVDVAEAHTAKGAGALLNAYSVGKSMSAFNEAMEKKDYDAAALHFTDMAANSVDMGNDIAGVMKNLSPEATKKLTESMSRMSPSALKSAMPALSGASKVLSRSAPVIGVALDTFLQEGNFIEKDGSLGDKSTRAVGSTIGAAAAIGVGGAATAATSVAAAPLAAAVLVGYSASEFTSIAIEFDKNDRRFIITDEMLSKQNYLQNSIMRFKGDMKEQGAVVKDNGALDLSDERTRAIVREVLVEKRAEFDAERQANSSIAPDWMRAGYTNGKRLQAEKDAIRMVNSIDSAMKQLDYVDDQAKAHAVAKDTAAHKDERRVSELSGNEKAKLDAMVKGASVDKYQVAAVAGSAAPPVPGRGGGNFIG